VEQLSKLMIDELTIQYPEMRSYPDLQDKVVAMQSQWWSGGFAMSSIIGQVNQDVLQEQERQLYVLPALKEHRLPTHAPTRQERMDYFDSPEVELALGGDVVTFKVGMDDNDTVTSLYEPNVGVVSGEEIKFVTGMVNELLEAQKRVDMTQHIDSPSLRRH